MATQAPRCGGLARAEQSSRRRSRGTVGESVRLLSVAFFTNWASNGYRSRVWKFELHEFADETHLRVRVSHFPPGTSKWNKIEHRLFCHITANWRGKPLTTIETIVDLIGNTRTAEGLRVKAKIDRRKYPRGAKVSKSQMNDLALVPAKFHGDWNYELRSRES